MHEIFVYIEFLFLDVVAIAKANIIWFLKLNKKNKNKTRLLLYGIRY